MIDTKTLYDWANEAGLNFKDEDGYHDAVAVWVDAIMADPSWLLDFWLDALADLTDDDKARQQSDLLDAMRQLHSNLRHLNSTFRGDTNFAFINDTALRSSLIGQVVYKTVLSNIEKMVEDSASEWWGDVCAYDYDMQQAAYEDHYEGRAYERRQEAEQ